MCARGRPNFQDGPLMPVVSWPPPPLSLSTPFSTFLFACRDEDRDVSEKIALGQAQPTMSKEMMFDQRLFNQPTGLAVSLGDEEAYNVYDKPFAMGAGASTIYRPRKDADPELDPSALDKIAKTERFVPDKGFQGADKAEKRGNNPVEFEKAEPAREQDPFGLDQFLTSSKAKRGLDVVGARGSMAASYGLGARVSGQG